MTAAFGGSLGWGARPALVVVDMMRAYFTPGSPFDLGSRSAVDGCAVLLAAARSAGIPVLHTVVRYGAGAADAGLFVRKVPGLRVLAADAEGALGDVVAELAPAATEVVVVKQYASAFFGTSLSATLTAGGVDTVVLCGVSTSGCVRASATDALQHGFRPIVVSEACGDRTAAIHEANLTDLAAKYADVISLDEALTHLTPL